MRAFVDILAEAAAWKGGLSALEATLATTPALDRSVIAQITDDRILAEMSRRVFNAGFSSKVIEAKWPAFEDAFRAFDPRACAFMSEEAFDALLRDVRIVRNGPKVRSVQINAALVMELATQHGSAATFFADCPDEDYVRLLTVLRDKGSHLSGDAGQRFLRAIGKPAFIATKDVVAALVLEGVISRAPRSQQDYAVVQQAFNQWSRQSGRNLTAISRILAMIGEANAGELASPPKGQTKRNSPPGRASR